MAEARVVVTELVPVEWVVVVATELILVVVGELLLGNVVVVMAILEVTGSIQITPVNTHTPTQCSLNENQTGKRVQCYTLTKF